MSCAKKLIRLSTGGLAMAWVLSANGATLVTVGLTGTVAPNGEDVTGIFGPPATSLAGQPFELRFVFDLGLGIRTSSALSDELVGGPKAGLTMPMLVGQMTIDGKTASYPLTGHIHLTASSGQLNMLVDFYEPPLRDDEFLAVLYSPALQPSLSTPIATALSGSSGQFQFRTDAPSQALFHQFAYGQLNFTSISISSSPVSEPSTWGMLGAGLAAIAMCGRRRRPSAPC